ncbi:MAG: AbrB/MazE/SpoVT family DNA-binding domain-containing protein [archaeon]
MKFMNTCYKCGTNVKQAKIVKEGITLTCMKCPKCGEEYYTSSELLRFDVLTGKRKLVRKFGTLGDSTILRIPPEVLKDFNIKPEDYALFEKKDDGIFIRPVSAKET